MKTLKDLLTQKAELEEEIQNTQKRERHDALGQIKLLMDQYGLTVADLNHVKSAKKGGKIAAKYYDPNTGGQWTGRGLKPKWVQTALAAGKDLSDFLIK